MMADQPIETETRDTLTLFEPEAGAEGLRIDLEGAADWIKRWREAMGGFYVREGARGIEVQLARKIMQIGYNLDVYGPLAEALEAELLADVSKMLTVAVLARNSWETTLLQTVEPAGTA